MSVPLDASSNKLCDEKLSNDPTLLQYANSATLHGIKSVLCPGAKVTVKRIVWSIILSIFALTFLHTVYSKITLFLRYEHITQVDEESKTLKFPALTICNVNPVRVSAFTKNDLWNAGEMYDLLDKNKKLSSHISKKVSSHLLKISDFKNYRSSHFDLQDFQLRAGHQMKDMLLRCKWRNERCYHYNFTPILTSMGLCYQFNSKDTDDSYSPRKVYKGGQGNGLKLLLITQEDDYLPPKTEEFEQTFEAGFKLQVHDADIPPLVKELGLGVSPGLQTFVVLQKTNLTYLGSPHGNCIPNVIREDGRYPYSEAECRITCETRDIVNICGCRLPFMPDLPDLPQSEIICKPDKVINCARKRLEFLEDGAACGPNSCAKTCYVTKYTASLSSVRFPSIQAVRALHKEYGHLSKNRTGFFKKNAVAISVYFQSLNSESIRQVKAYEFPSMLGDIGGLMGLFLGASAMTIFEFLTFVVNAITVRVKKCFQKLCYGKSTRTTSQSETYNGHRYTLAPLEASNLSPRPLSQLSLTSLSTQ